MSDQTCGRKERKKYHGIGEKKMPPAATVASQNSITSTLRIRHEN